MTIWVIEDLAGLAREVLSYLVGLKVLADAEIQLVSPEEVIADVEHHRGGGLFAPRILIDPRFAAHASDGACAAFHDALAQALVVHFTDMEKMDMHLLRHLKSASPHCLLSLVSDWRKDLKAIVEQVKKHESQTGGRMVVSTPPNAPLR